MKKALILGILCLASGTAIAQNCQIAVSVAGVPDSTRVQIALAATHAEEAPLAESIAIAGKATFEVSLPEPRLIAFSAQKSYGLINFMAQNGDKITVTANAIIDRADEIPFYNYQNVSVSGSASHQEFMNRIEAPRAILDSQYAAYHRTYANALKAMSDARQINDTARAKEIANTPEFQAFSKAESDFFNTVQQTYNKMFDDNNDSFWGPLSMLYVMNYFTENDSTRFKKFAPQAQQSFYGKLLKKQIMPDGLVGKRCPAFSGILANGEKASLESICKGKRYILLDFWASWCKPCRREIPNVKAQYELYKDKGFEVISVSTDKVEAQWRKALSEEDLPWPNFREADVALESGESCAKAFNIRFIPLMFVIDAQTGKVIAANIHGEHLAKKLSSLFK